MIEGARAGAEQPVGAAVCRSLAAKWVRLPASRMRKVLSGFQGRRAALSIALLGVLLLALHGLVLPALSSRGDGPLLTEAPRQQAFAAVPGVPGSYATDPEAAFKLLAFPVSLQSHTRYRACVPVLRAAEPTRLVVDLQGSGYDDAAQEASFDIGLTRRARQYCFDFDSAAPPADVVLRVMQDAGPSVEIGTPTLGPATLPAWMSRVDRVALPAAATMLVLAFVLWLMRRVVQTPQHRSSGLEADALMAVALVAVVTYAVVVAYSSAVPWVFVDEYSYAWLAKHEGDFALAQRVGIVSMLAQSFLYFKVYALAFASALASAELAKALNLAFWLGAGAAAYIAARRLLSRSQAAGFALVALLSPWIIFVRLFMPEAMYLFGFWVCVAAFVWTWTPTDPRGEALLGAGLGALALVKSHAILLLPGFLFGIGAALLMTGPPRLRAVVGICARASVLLIAYFAAKLLLTFSLTGSATSAAFGGYGGEAARVSSLLAEPAQAATQVGLVLLRHAGIVVLVVGAALLAALTLLSESFSRTAAPPTPKQQVVVLVAASALGLLASLMLITALFTVAVADAGPHESALRTHSRYYGFLLPLVLLAGMAASQCMREPQGPGKRRLPIALALVLLSTGWLLMDPIALNANDGPDALAARLRPLGVALQIGVVSLLVALVYASFRRGLQWIAASTLVYFLGANFVYWSVYHAQSSQPAPEDLAGRRFRLLVAEALNDRGVIVASENSVPLQRLLYYVNAGSPVHLRADGNVLPEDYVGKAWVLTHGVSPSAAGMRSVPLGGKATLLLPIDSSGTAVAEPTEAGAARSRFELTPGGGIVVIGAHAPEPWGVWLPPTAILRFDEPLAGDVRTELWLRGYGPNAGRTITAVLGGARSSFEAPRELSKVELSFSNVKQGGDLRFEGLVAASPRSLGESGDERELALGLSRASAIVESRRRGVRAGTDTKEPNGR